MRASNRARHTRTRRPSHIATITSQLAPKTPYQSDVNATEQRCLFLSHYTCGVTRRAQGRIERAE